MQLTYRGSFYQADPSFETTEGTTTLKYRGVAVKHSILSERLAAPGDLTLTYRGNRYVTQR